MIKTSLSISIYSQLYNFQLNALSHNINSKTRLLNQNEAKFSRLSKGTSK